MPGIGDVELVETLESLWVSGHDGHVVDQRCRADEDIADRRRIRYVQGSRATRHPLVHREHSILERSDHALVEPCTEQCSLRRVGTHSTGAGRPRSVM